MTRHPREERCNSRFRIVVSVAATRPTLWSGMTDADTDTAATPARDSAPELLTALRRLAAARQVEIRVEPKRLNHIDSPVAFEADGNIWVYAFLAAAAFAGWRWGLVTGGATLALGIAVYLTLGRAYVHRRIERRVRRDALENLEKWRKLWRFSGLTLVAAGRPDLAACTSPNGNWMGFVRAALSPRETPP
jgi:hypothetical protein